MLTIGIVGLPNVGKSTLFQVLTKKQVLIANYPFATIEPNIGVVNVPDERLEILGKISKSGKIVPTTVSFVDIAGLVKGANSGEGLGNKFLSHIREVDAICEVVRSFKDDNVMHVSGSIDPKTDIEVISIELALADLNVVNQNLEPSKTNKKNADPKRTEVLEKLKKHLETGSTTNIMSELSEDERVLIKPFNLLTLKPKMYVTNIDESDLKIANNSNDPGHIQVCAKLELELAELPEDMQLDYLQNYGMTESGINKIIHAGYKMLNLLTFITTGEMETKAWTITAGSTAIEAAGKIHTDFIKKFIRAEITTYEDFIKTNGKCHPRLEGKNYIMQEGDIVYFRINN